MPDDRRICYFHNLDAMSEHAAEVISRQAADAVQKRCAFVMALSGGSTPTRLYEMLAAPPFKDRIPWEKTHLFWGDERCAPADHPDGNYHAAEKALLSKIDIPEQNVRRVPTEAPGGPSEAADRYSRMIEECFGLSPDDPPPAFDLILLGIGSDGHTASLFPDDDALAVTDRWVVEVNDPKGSPKVPRVTFTFPLIDAARNVLFLSSWSGKEGVIREILEDPEDAKTRYPAAQVHPTKGRLSMFFDKTGYLDSPRRLIVFTRYPEPGKVKTRLIPKLGPEGAATLQRLMTERTVGVSRRLTESLAGVSLEIRFDGREAGDMARWLGGDLVYRRQNRGDLGMKMFHAMMVAGDEGAKEIVLIGTDCPDLTPEILQKAFEALSHADVVLGPAKDGGYYLLGLKRPDRAEALFRGVSWGTETVLSETLAAAETCGLKTALVDTLQDVDREEDLPVWENRIP